MQDGKKKRSLNPEIQFVLPNNRNEAGFSKHEVYDLKKIISANVRLFGALTIGNLGYLLSQYKSIFDPRSLLNHLLYPQDGSAHPFLLLVTEKSQRTHKKKQYITTSDVYDEKV